MTINTTGDPPPDTTSDTTSDAATEDTVAALQPAAGEPDLEARIRQRRAQLIGALRELAADMRSEAPEARVRLKAKLSELKHIVKWGVSDGWARVGAPVAHKLEEWLAGSAHQPAAKEPAEEPM